MSRYAFHDENIERIIESRYIHTRLTDVHSLERNSSLVKKFSKIEIWNCLGGINALAWNSSGSRLVSAANNDRIHVWTYPDEFLEHQYMTARSNLGVNCIKFVPESSDSRIVYGTEHKQVRLYDVNSETPSTIIRCHSERVNNLAFPNGNPNIVWSCSDDSTIREHDLRERCGKVCKRVILDLSDQTRHSLAYPPTGPIAINSFDISQTSPELIFVGGSDRFARLYDRRSLQLGRSRIKELPPVNYYCPRHLSLRSNVFRSSKKDYAISHVAFSPLGHEVVISYEKENIYVMNVHHDGANEDSYSPDDVIKMMKVDVNRDASTKTEETIRDIKIRDRVRQLLEGCTPSNGIDILNAVLSLKGPPIDPQVILEWLCSRANFLIERKWKYDVHMAIRDCDRARKINNGDYRPLYFLSKALLQLDRRTEALKSARAAKLLNPLNSEVEKLIEDINSNDGPESRGWIGEVETSPHKPRNGTQWSHAYKAIDMKQRFIGHWNQGKIAKEVNFLGPTGEYVVSGSDDGRVYIWEKRSGRLIRTLISDLVAVNCVQCHPRDFVVATGGDDNEIEIWAPLAAAEPVDDLGDLKAMEKNQKRLL